MEENKATNFEYFISMALRKKIPWNMLLVFLDDLTPTLVKSKQAIEILVKHLQCLDAKLQENQNINGTNEVTESDTIDVEIIDALEKSTVTEIENKSHANKIVHVQGYTDQINPVVGTQDKDDQSRETEVVILEDDEPENNSQDILSQENSGITIEQELSNEDNCVMKGQNVEKEVDKPFQLIDDESENQKQSDDDDFDYLSDGLVTETSEMLDSQDEGNANSMQISDDDDDSNEEQENNDENLKQAENNAEVNEEIGNGKNMEDMIVNQFYEFVGEPKELHENHKTSKVNEKKSRNASLKCKNCQKSFRQKKKLKEHEVVHTGGKPFQCATCSKRFSFKSALKNHIMIHDGTFPCHCQTCGKGFPMPSLLKVHERIHNGERPYQCKICSTSFRQITNLKRHKTIHTNEKQFKCKNCMRCFSQSSSLKRHEKIHY